MVKKQDSKTKHPRAATGKSKGGRPTKLTQKLANKIFERLALAESLRSITRDSKMPSMSTVMRWLNKEENDWFREQYARAKEAGIDFMAEDMLDIADDGTNDWMEKIDKDGKNIGWELNGEAVQRSKLRVDTRKWIASKLKPKKYGDKLDLSGKVDSTVNVEIVDFKTAVQEKDEGSNE